MFLKRYRLQIILSSIIFIVAIATRLIFLDLIPTSFSHDEMSYLINAVSLAKTGVGRYGDWLPFSFQPVEAYLSELPTVMLAPFLYLPFSLTVNARLLPVIMSLTMPFLIASISFSLLKSRKASFFSWGLALFNPWIWQNGRMIFDIPISLWFYVLGMALFLHFKSWNRLLALLPFFIGFYSYQGFKLILPFVGLALSIFVLLEEKSFKLSLRKLQSLKKMKLWKKIGPSVITSIFAIGLLSYYLVFQFGNQAASKARISNQIITPKSEVVVQAVNTDRRLAIQTPVNTIFVNKYVQTIKEIGGKYLQIFGWKELFFEVNAASSSFAVWNHGLFYLLDALLIGLGVLSLILKKKRAQLFLISTLAITGVLPAALNQSSWLYFRQSFVFPLLLILAGVGLNLLWVKNKRWIFAPIALAYAISIINFGFIYFVRYPIYASENIYFSPRLLVEYLNRLPKEQEVVIFEKEPEFVFTNLVFYYQLLNLESASGIHQAYKTKTYEWENLSFLPCVPTNFKPKQTTTYVFDSDVPDCQNPDKQVEKPPSTEEIFLNNAKPIFIKSIKDSGENYAIYNQTLCSSPEKLSHFLRPQSLKLFDFEKLSIEEFCQNWMTKGLQ